MEDPSKSRPINLVVCPTSLTYNWAAEVTKFFSGFKAVVLEGTVMQRQQIVQEINDYDLVIVNYEKLKSCLPMFKENDVKFFYVVLDEAHKIKNSKSVIT